MTTKPFDLTPGEEVLGDLRADGFFANRHGSPRGATQVYVTTERLVALEEQGMLKKRLVLIGEWSWRQFTERTNASEGNALGAGRYMLALFIKDDETIGTGFRNERSMYAFREIVARGMIPHLD